jgi:orotidine-5'-phosphate decarboxylase
MKVKLFRKRVSERIEEVNSCVCVGLNSAFERLPLRFRKQSFGKGTFEFNRLLVNATHQYTAAFSFNVAFYESHGGDGMSALRETIRHCGDVAPGLVVILDYKVGDNAYANTDYATKAFTYYRANAVTVQPGFGLQAMKPFLDQTDRGVFVLCHASNPGADEFQGLMVEAPGVWDDGMKLAFGTPHDRMVPQYEYVAYRVSHCWNTQGNCALVVGATKTKQLRRIREISGGMPLLFPDSDVQETRIGEVVPAIQDSQGGGMLIGSSEKIVMASGDQSFAKEAQKATIELRDEINEHRSSS